MKHLIIYGSVLLAAASSAAAQDLTLRPGQLADQIGNVSLSPAAHLTIRGAIDVRDLLTLRDNEPAGGVLDLSNADISGFNFSKPSYLGRSIFGEKALPAYIFFQSNWDEVILPADMKSIEAGAFSGSKIKRVSIPENVEVIAEYAFYGCDYLEFVSIPDNVKSIGKGAFAGCRNLQEVDMRDSKVSDIPAKCFADCPNLAFLFLPQSIESVGSEAFSSTSLTEIILPKVKYLAPYSLAGMPLLESVTLNKDAVFSEGTLMNNGRLERISGAPANLPPLFAANCYSFAPSDIISTTGNVGSFAFSNSTATELILSGDIAYVGTGAFSGMNSLERIDATSLKADIPEAHAEAFAGIEPSEVVLMVDHQALDDWRQHNVWGRFNVQSDITTSIEDIAPDPVAISVAVDGRILKVAASSNLTNGGIFSIDGASLAQLPTGVSSAEIPLDNISEKVVIVTVSTADSHKTVKVLLK